MLSDNFGHKRLAGLISRFLPGNLRSEVLLIGTSKVELSAIERILTEYLGGDDSIRIEKLDFSTDKCADQEGFLSLLEKSENKRYDLAILCSLRESVNRELTTETVSYLLSKNVLTLCIEKRINSSNRTVPYKKDPSSEKEFPTACDSFGYAGVRLNTGKGWRGFLDSFFLILERLFLVNTFFERSSGPMIISVYCKQTVESNNRICGVCGNKTLRKSYFIAPYFFSTCSSCGTLFARKIFQPNGDFCHYQREWDSSTYDTYYSSLRYLQADRIIENLKRFKNIHSILDIGCGRGFFIARAKANSYRVEGIDISLPELQNRIVPECMREISIEQKESEGIRYDCLSFLGVLEHVSHYGKFLELCANLLHSDGLIVFSIPLLEGPVYSICECLYRYSFGLIRTPWLTLLQWHSTSPHIFLPSKKGVYHLLKNHFSVDAINIVGQPIIDRSKIFQRIKLEYKTSSCSKAKTMLLYSFGVLAVLIDWAADLLGLLNEAVFYVQIKRNDVPCIVKK